MATTNALYLNECKDKCEVSDHYRFGERADRLGIESRHPYLTNKSTLT